jgi:hypothetical protein
MDKVHIVAKVSITGTTMSLQVDGREYEVDLARQSRRLAQATQPQRENSEISPGGYGIHWPDLDEDLSIDGLIGVSHVSPIGARVASA